MLHRPPSRRLANRRRPFARLDALLRTSLLLAGGLLVFASNASAAVVEFTQTSSPAGIFSAPAAYPDTATVAATQTAPATDNTGYYSFVGWTLNGVRAAASLGQALNPASFTIYEPTQAVAVYIPTLQDDDTDGVQDWFELRHIGSLFQDADSDLDGDGFPLAVEQDRGSSPVFADRFDAGGQSRRRSSTLVGYSAPIPGNVQLSTVTDPANFLPGTSKTVTAWTAATLPVMPVSSSGYRFTGWLVDGVRIDDPARTQPTPITIGVNTTATARYTPELADSDADRVPDWFELLHHDTLAHDAAYDADADGLPLLAEAARSTSPRLVNTYAGAGFSRRRAAELIPVNLSGYLSYEFRTSPSGLAATVSGSASPGAIIASPDYFTTSVPGYAFAYWEIDGVRQVDPLTGGAAGRLRFELTAPLVATAIFLPSTIDSDSDGVPDWYELRHYGDLARPATDDEDGDGLTLIDEAGFGASPRLVDRIASGGVSRRRESATTIVNLQFFERLRRVPVSGVLSEIFSPDPNNATGQNFGADAAPALGDWDGDGDLDLFVASTAGLAVYENVGTRHTLHFENRSTAFAGLGALAAAHGPTRLALGDWNADGRADLALGGSDGIVRFVVSDGSFSGSAPSAPAFVLATGSASAAPALGDLDGDAAPELLVLLADGTTRFYPNGGATTPFADAIFTDDYLGVPITQGVAVGVGDINGDGRADIVASDAEGRLWEFPRTEAGFALLSKVWAGSGRGFASGLSVALADLDGDGDTDALGGAHNGALVGLRDPRVGRPVGLTPVSGAQHIALTWDPDRQDRITGYHVYRATASDGSFERLTTAPLSLPAYTDAAVVPGLTYHYQVTGLTDAYLPGNSLPRTVESLPSETASATAGVIGFAVRPARAAAGKTVKIRLAIANPFAIAGAGLQLKLAYDPALLTPISQINPHQAAVSPSAIARDLVFADNAASASGELIVTGSGGALNLGDGTLFVLSFSVAPGALADATSTVTLTHVAARDIAGRALAWECAQNGVLTVSGDYAEGDLTGDGVVDKDDQHLLSDLLKLDARPPTADELSAGDLNADGLLDQDDFVLLKRLLNGRPLE